MGCNVSSVKGESGRDYIENGPTLLETEKLAIKHNWQILKQHVANIGVKTYVSMFVNRPELMEVFSVFKGKDVSELQRSGLLRKHALRVMSTIDKCVPCFFSMFVNRPELMEVFSAFKGKDVSELQRSGLLRKHALRVMSTIDKCVSSIDDPASVKHLLREVGHHHRLYNVPSDYIQVILPHFLSAIKSHLQDDWSDEVQEAWVCFLKLILYHIRDGMKSDADHSSAGIQTDTNTV